MDKQFWSKFFQMIDDLREQQSLIWTLRNEVKILRAANVKLASKELERE